MRGSWRDRRLQTVRPAVADQGNGMPGQIIIECDACGEEFQLSDDCALVVTSAEVILFKVVHDGHGAVDIAVRASD
jgi:hypothetical protein